MYVFNIECAAREPLFKLALYFQRFNWSDLDTLKLKWDLEEYFIIKFALKKGKQFLPSPKRKHCVCVVSGFPTTLFKWENLLNASQVSPTKIPQ